MASAEALAISPPTPTSNPLGTMTSSKRKREAVPGGGMAPGIANIISYGPPPKLAFDPEKHLNFQPPSKVYTMKEIGLGDKGVSRNAVSEPFPLFTKEAVQQMRAEALRKEVFDNCQYSSNLSKGQLRGFAPE